MNEAVVNDLYETINRNASKIIKLKKINEKLKGWHAKALRVQVKMSEDIEPLYNKIEDLEEQNKKIKENLEIVYKSLIAEDYIAAIELLSEMLEDGE